MITFNRFLIIYLVVYVVTSVADMLIDRINARYGRKFGKEVPEPFKGVIDEGELEKINQYTLDNTSFSMVRTGTHKILFLSIILSGVLPWFANALSGVNFVLAGLIFFALPGFFMMLIDLPFDYYHSFIIEERYDFNTKTIMVWVSDLIKTLVLTAVIGTILMSALFLMVRYAAETWWIWIWAFFLGFQLLMTILYPTVIAPLFNRFTPIEDPDLVRRIKELAKKEGLNLKGIYQMDATKRSRHSNAYFSGLGKAKRIVLFDSLIQSHGIDEIVAILAHEIGHLKKNHIKKQLAIFSLASVFLFYLASKMITWEPMFESFGFADMPAYAGLFLVGVLWEPVGFFLSPVGMAISRRFEREADLYSLKIIKAAGPLISALKKMAKDNLSNLRPHPLYIWFNYSHPPLLERIRRLEENDPVNK